MPGMKVDGIVGAVAGAFMIGVVNMLIGFVVIGLQQAV